MYSDNVDIIEIKNLSYKYKKEQAVLKNININIKKGSFHGLIGANGAGKSTLIKLLVKSLNIQTGEINIKSIEKDINTNSIVISFFPDEAIFPSSMSVYDYLRNEVCIFKNISPKYLKEKLLTILKDFGIEDVINKSPNNLSSGQKKKIELIRIMLEEPEIVILDEPTNFLDIQTRMFMLEFLKWLNEKGTTIIISSHILHEMKDYIDSVTILDNGEIKYTGLTNSIDIIDYYNSINMEKTKVFKDDKVY